ncbi:MAG: hypothetical protein ACYTHJ_10130 [Planctomycetota bacterium]|jgi:hypothetical protein
MADGTVNVTSAALAGFNTLDAEFAATRSQQMRSVQVRRASGNGDIKALFSLGQKFRLVYVRCGFAGGSGSAPLAISLNSAAGTEFDIRLFTLMQVGSGSDVNFRITAEELAEPSAWTFQPGDAVRLNWANPEPGQTSWGVEVGLAPAS